MTPMQELIAIINRQAKTLAKELAAVEITNCPVDEIFDDEESEVLLANKQFSQVKENTHVEQDYRLCEAAGTALD
jgi:hypothetical protein